MGRWVGKLCLATPVKYVFQGAADNSDSLMIMSTAYLWEILNSI